MKEIKLTNGMAALVDDEDFEYINQFKWFAHKGGNTFYADRHQWIDGKDTTVKMHRVIIGLKPSDKLHVDHINHNGLDNRKENLRVCTFHNNIKNKQSVKGSTSKFKGVSTETKKYFNKTNQEWRMSSLKYKARICVDYKQIFLGSFSSEIDAAKAYNEAAEKYFGEFAYLNTF